MTQTTPTEKDLATVHGNVESLINTLADGIYKPHFDYAVPSNRTAALLKALVTAECLLQGAVKIVEELKPA